MTFIPKTNSNFYFSVPKSSSGSLYPKSTPLGNTTWNEEASTSEEFSIQNTSLVRITWRDAETHGGPGWVALEDAIEFAQQEPPIMRTIGYLVHRQEGTDGWIAVTDTIGPNECASVHKIPNCMILRLEMEPTDEALQRPSEF